MENRLDQLFKNKLAKREEIPSPKAWGQIQGQLKSGKRKLWMKRLAVAAAILLFATVGAALLNIQSSESEKNLSKSMNGTEGKQPQVGYRMDKVFSRIIGVDSGAIREQIKEHNNAPAGQQDITAEKQDLEIPLESEQKITKPLMIKKQLPQEERHLVNIEAIDSEISTNPEANGLDDSTKSMENEGISDVAEAPQLAGNNERESPAAAAVEQRRQRKVTIIYKASKNSTLVESGKKNILEKGLGEISKFSNEHLLTDSRKAQFSQTKDDLLALNFGKLFTNSNEEKRTKNP